MFVSERYRFAKFGLFCILKGPSLFNQILLETLVSFSTCILKTLKYYTHTLLDDYLPILSELEV